jgi:methylenetetrahydrofolate reductase (NADPH)
MRPWTPVRRADPPDGKGDVPSFSVSIALRPHYLSYTPPSSLLLDLVERSVREGRVHSFFLSAGWAGHGDLSSTALAREILRRGGTPVVSIACADRSREEILRSLRAFHGEGVRDFLIVTGDYPRDTRRRGEEPIFDVDAVQILMLLREADVEKSLADTALGCVVSPFKFLEAELYWQYARLQRKTRAGGDFIVSQAGFDARKWDELARYSRLAGIDRPLIGHVLVPDSRIAKIIGEGLVPGVTMPPSLFARIEEESRKGDGRTAGLRRAAGAVAIHRGLGYDGVLLGGSALNHDDLSFVLDEADRLSPRWEEMLEENLYPDRHFYYFQSGGAKGLNEDRPVEAVIGNSRNFMYVASHLIDHIAFGSRNIVFWTLYRTCRFCDRRPFWGRVLWLVEYISKRPLYGCRMCGDCTLYASAFICYEKACPKKMLNGPCGGSLDGWCEVHPGRKKCLWVRVYERLKAASPRPAFATGPIPPKDRRLDGTCSWINFFLGRDHRKMKVKSGDG